MLTFSRIVERRFSTGSAEKPIARIAIGMADSMPWPSFSATYATASENSHVIPNPKTTDRTETSGIGLPAGTIGR